MFRWIALAVFVASLAISAYRRRRQRQATGTIRRVRENLIAAFGDAYRDYRTATGALLPVPPRGGRHG